MTIRKALTRHIAVNAVTGYKTFYMTCNVFAKDVMHALGEDPEDPILDWAVEYVARATKLGLSMTSQKGVDLSPISVGWTLAKLKDADLIDATEALLRHVPAADRYIECHIIDMNNKQMYEFKRNQYSLAELKQYLIRDMLAHSPEDGNTTNVAESDMCDTEGNVLDTTPTADEDEQQDASEHKDSDGEDTSGNEQTMSELEEELGMQDTTPRNRKKKNDPKALMEALRVSQQETILYQKRQLELQEELLQSQQAQLELQRKLLEQNKQQKHQDPVNLTSAFHDLNFSPTTKPTTTRPSSQNYSNPPSIDLSQTSTPAAVSPKARSRKAFSRARRNFSDQPQEDTKGALVYWHNDSMMWMMYETFARTKGAKKRILVNPSEILEIYNDLADRARAHGIFLTPLTDIQKWNKESAAPTCPYNESNTVQYRRVYLTATTSLYTRIAGTLSFKRCQLFQRYMDAHQDSQDGYRVLYDMLCRTHPRLRQVNNIPVPVLTDDIWTFMKAYRGYVNLKTLNEEVIDEENQYNYVKTQLLAFDRSTYQDILHLCDGEYIAWKRNPYDEFPEELRLQNDNIINKMITVCEDLHYSNDEINDIFGSTGDDTTSVESAQVNYTNRIKNPYTKPKHSYQEREPKRYQSGEPKSILRNRKSHNNSKRNQPTIERREYLDDVVCPLCAKSGHHPDKNGCDVAGALFSVASAIIPDFVEEFLPRKHHAMAIKVMHKYKKHEDNKAKIRKARKSRKDYIRTAAASESPFKLITAVGKALNPKEDPKMAAAYNMVATNMIDDSSDESSYDSSSTNSNQSSDQDHDEEYETTHETDNE